MAEDHLDSWDSLLPDSDLDSQVFGTKKFKCKYKNCNRGYKSSQSRSRHYRNDHKSEMPPKKDPTFSNNFVFNLVTESTNSSACESNKMIDQSGLRDAITLTQSFFNHENTDTAIAMIKGSALVQENAKEMRFVN